MTTWPFSLPQKPLAEGYVEEFPNLLLRTDMDAGPAKVRRRFTAGVRKYSVRYLLTGQQLQALDHFVMTTLKGGASRFYWPHPRTGEMIEVRLVSLPKVEAQGRFYKVNLDLEQLP